MKASLLVALVLVACGPAPRTGNGNGTDDAGQDEHCALACSADLQAVVDCRGDIVESCTGGNACDPTFFTCTEPCAAAEANRRSVGCDYYATQMDTMTTGYCFAAFVANTWTQPAHITVEYNGQPLDTQAFTRIPSGSGPSLTHGTYDAAAGLPPGQVAILFLGGTQGSAPYCPVTPAAANARVSGTGIGNAFHIKTDVPVVAYQINPYGGGSVAVTAGSLLLPTSVWDLNYVGVNVSAQGVAGSPSMNIIAKEDGTVVTLTPNAAVTGGGAIPGGAAGQPLTINLNKGQHAQITQSTELTGSAISSTKPIGVMAGQTCMNMPTSTPYCDHGEQMIAPVKALGHRYVGVMYRPRVPAETSTFWRIIGAADGTQLTWSTNVGGPTTLNAGQSVIFETGTPFTVQSQDPDHPFMLFTYMTSSTHVQSGYGDPDFVTSVPPEQYLQQYVFFTDPTYPETNLVVVRSRSPIDNQFKDVMLDCAGALTGWQPIGSDFEFTRHDLTTGNFAGVGGCSTGRREMKSDAPFGLWVWGWGTPLTSTFTENVSYGYPGGMNVAPINTIIF
jgi:hypothetical protein